MIEAIHKNLEKGIKLVASISNEEYANQSVPPYFASIGSHMRHILDVFSCVFNGFKEKKIDLTKRDRNEKAEQNTAIGIKYFRCIIEQLHQLTEEDLSTKIKISDDLGLGKVTADCTLGAALMQAQSHAIHHFASIGYIICQLEIELPNEDFGINPTTPKKIKS